MLSRLDLPRVSYIGSNATPTVTTLILRNEQQVCTLVNTNGVNSNAYIYVPAALVDSYKAASNWSTYADQIRAIEDYPDICGGA
jgi:hypothetical protein